MVVARKAAETQAVMLPDGGFARSAVDVVDRANLGALATFDAEVRIHFEFAVGDYLVKEYAADDSAVKPWDRAFYGYRHTSAAAKDIGGIFI